MAKKAKAFVPLGVGPLFPGPKYKPKRGTLPDVGLLKREILRLSAELGPDHPQVKMLKKDLANKEAK